MRDQRDVDMALLYRRAWHTASRLMVLAFVAFLVVGGLHWGGGHSLQRALGVGLVFPVVLGSVAGVVEARAVRASRRIRTFSRGNLRASLFAGAWAAAWSIPFVAAIGLQEGTLQPYLDNALAPLGWGGACCLGAALPVGRS